MPRKINNKWNYKKKPLKKTINVDFTIAFRLFFGALLVLAIFFGLRKIKSTNLDFGANFFKSGERAVSSTRTSELDLPITWKIVKKDEGEVLLRSEKATDDQIIPTILFLKLNSQDKLIDEAYIEKLKQGAKKVIPKLVYEKTKMTVFEPFTKYEFKGQYTSRGKYISLTQMVFKTNTDTYLYTISSEKNQLPDEELAMVNKRVEDWFMYK